jgi:spermidine/putrescine transport system permease protein
MADTAIVRTASALEAGESQAERIAREAAERDVRKRWLLASPALLILLVAANGPLLIVLVYSFLAPGDYGNVKWQFSTDGWLSVVMQRDIFDDTLQWADAHLSIFWRSAKLSLVTTFLTLIFGVPTAYFIATRPEKSRNWWLFLITIPFWSNLLIRTIAVMELLRAEGAINSLLVGLRIITEPIQLLFTDFAIAFGMTYVFLPLMVLPVYASIEKLDFRLVEAGYDLYANRWQVFWRITLPLIKPGIIAGSILVFIPSLGAYVTPRVLGGGKNLMIGNLIELQFGQGRNWPLGAALSLTLMAIVLIALVFYVRASAGQQSRQGHV